MGILHIDILRLGSNAHEPQVSNHVADYSQRGDQWREVDA